MLFFCCFQTVFPLAVHSLTEWEVKQQVKPTPACLTAVMLLKSGKRAWDQQGLAPTDIYRDSTFYCSSWCLFLAASVYCMTATENQQFGDKAVMLCDSLLALQRLQITRRKKQLRLTTKTTLGLGKGTVQKRGTKTVALPFILWNWFL